MPVKCRLPMPEETLNGLGLPLRLPRGWYVLHCEECGRLIWTRHVRILSRRCRECGGVIRPGTADHWLAHLERVEQRMARKASPA
jgi:PHP family Zn ribbon phosphoesterase